MTATDHLGDAGTGGDGVGGDGGGQRLLVTRRQVLAAAGVVGAGWAATALVGCTTDGPPSGTASSVPGSGASGGTTVGSGPAAGPTMGQAEFVSLSSRLTGVDPEGLDLVAAGTILAALAPQSAALERLSASLDGQTGDADPVLAAADVPVARAVMTAWYTGMVDTTVATWTGTLSWTVPHATAPGVCGGFGTWAEPPTATHGGM